MTSQAKEKRKHFVENVGFYLILVVNYLDHVAYSAFNGLSSYQKLSDFGFKVCRSEDVTPTNQSTVNLLKSICLWQLQQLHDGQSVSEMLGILMRMNDAVYISRSQFFSSNCKPLDSLNCSNFDIYFVHTTLFWSLCQLLLGQVALQKPAVWTILSAKKKTHKCHKPNILNR